MKRLTSLHTNIHYTSEIKYEGFVILMQQKTYLIFNYFLSKIRYNGGHEK